MQSRRTKVRPHHILEICVALFICVILLYITIPRFIRAQNINTPENFPDPNFRAAIEKFMGVEPGGVFTQSQARDKTWQMNCDDQNIQSLQGIELFQNITDISIKNNKLQEIDLSKNPKITTIQCKENPIQSFRFADHNNISSLAVSDCGLADIDLSNLPHLQYLNVLRNNLTSIDLTHNPNLETLYSSENQLTEIIFPSSSALQFLSCGNNQFQSLDLSNCVNLQTLDCYRNPLTELQLPASSETIQLLWIQDNDLTSIQLGDYPNLLELNLRYNELVEIPGIDQFPSLYYFNVSKNRLDCGDWDTVQKLDHYFKTNDIHYKRAIVSQTSSKYTKEFVFSPQKGLDPFECE